MSLAPLLLAASLLSPSASAKGKGKGDDDGGVGIRLKFSTPVFAMANFWVENADVEEDDPVKAKSRTVSFFNQPNRFEATYLLGEGAEVGAILGYSSTRGWAENKETEAEDTLISKDTQATIALTGAYNIALGEGAKLFIQPIIGVDTFTTGLVDNGDNEPLKTRFVVYGGDVGVRLRLFKRATFDIAGEYLLGNGAFFDAEGEKDEDNTGKYNQFAIRGGLSVRI
jgi:hypothetical protein